MLGNDSVDSIVSSRAKEGPSDQSKDLTIERSLFAVSVDATLIVVWATGMLIETIVAARVCCCCVWLLLFQVSYVVWCAIQVPLST